MTYPLFYIPLKADRTTKTITLNIDLPLYINKKAIELSNYTTPKVVQLDIDEFHEELRDYVIEENVKEQLETVVKLIKLLSKGGSVARKG